MRSFIKKLAGAMALTMVVSSVAPAGAVFAADGDNYLALQGGDTRVEDGFTIALRSNPANQTPVDFRFVGAPDAWKNGVIWTSTNPAVATVDENGKVTALAEGKTMIIVSLKDGSWDASAWINVVSTAKNTVEGVFIAAQNTLSPLTSIEVSNKAGKEGVDLWYLNGEGEAKWVSSDETIATVTPNGGLVKGVVGANGIATVSLYLDGEIAASVEVIVGEPVVEEAKFVEYETAIAYKNYDESEEGDYWYANGLDLTVGEEVEVATWYDAAVVKGEEIIEDYAGFYDFALTSSDEEVVKVEDGKLVAVGAGEATITAVGTVVEGYEATAEATITVVKPVIDANFTVKQLSDKKVELTFANEEAAKAAKVTNLVKVLSNGATSKWLINGTPAVKDNKVIIETFAAFADEGNYRVYVTVDEEAKEVDFETMYGIVDTIEITYKSEENGTTIPGQTEKGKAYANAEDEDSIVVKLTPQLFSNGVNVTNAEGNDTTEISYELETESEYVDLIEDEDVYYLVFTKAGEKARVIAEYTITNAEGESEEVYGDVIVISEEAPRYYIDRVVAYTLVTETQRNKKELDWSKPVHSVRADEDAEFYVVAIVQDSYGNYYVTDEQFKDKKYNDTAVKYIADEDTKFEAEDYSIVMEVSDKTAMRVKAADTTDGSVALVAYKPAKASILFTLYKDDKKVSDFDAVEVTVDKKKEFTSIKVTEDISVPMKDTTDKYTTSKVVIELKDQDGNAWTTEEEVVVTAEKKYQETLKTKDYIVGNYKSNADGKVEITVDGAKFKEIFEKDGDTKSTEVDFTVTVGKKTAKFTVEAKKLTGKAKLELTVSDKVDQAKLNDEKTPVVKTAITLDMKQNGFKVGEESLTLVASSSALDAIKKYTKADVAEGAKFLVVEAPNGSYVTEKATSAAVEETTKNDAFIINTDGTYELVVARAELKAETATGSALKIMDYAATGTYKVKVYEVTGFDKEEGTAILKVKYEDDCVVENNNAVVTVNKQVKAEVEVESGMTDEEIIASAIQFKKGSDAWTITADDILAINVIGGVEEDADFLIVIDVTLKVAVNDKCGAYYTVNVPVDLSIDLVD